MASKSQYLRLNTTEPDRFCFTTANEKEKKMIRSRGQNIEVSDLMHPFMDFRQLWLYLRHKLPNNTRAHDFFCAFVKQESGQSPLDYAMSMKLQSSISSSGIEKLGIPPFKLRSYQNVARDKKFAKLSTSSAKYDDLFSAIEVHYEESDGGIQVVRVFAIVTFERHHRATRAFVDSEYEAKMNINFV